MTEMNLTTKSPPKASHTALKGFKTNLIFERKKNAHTFQKFRTWFIFTHVEFNFDWISKNFFVQITMLPNRGNVLMSLSHCILHIFTFCCLIFRFKFKATNTCVFSWNVVSERHDAYSEKHTKNGAQFASKWIYGSHKHSLKMKIYVFLKKWIAFCEYRLLNEA